MEDDKKSKHKQKKLSVFDYLETSINKKEDFQTPVIIPKNIEKPKEIVKQTNEGPKEINTNEKEKSTENTPLEWQEVLNPSEKPKENKTFTFKPKTELEKQVVESINKPVAEKKELFKSIFSDSESGESDNEETEVKDKEEVIPPLSKPLNAAAANLLRNNSPPRGIFKALFNTAKVTNETEKEKPIEDQNQTEIVANKSSNLLTENPNKVIFQPKSAREPKQMENAVETPEIYGPVLPKTFTTKTPTKTNTLQTSIDDKLLDLFNKHKPKLQVTEKWIEKSAKQDTTDSDDSSDSTNSSSSSDTSSIKHKKKSKKSKKKKSSSDHKHKKHKDHKSGKKSKKQEKKKKKHKKK